jgi:NADH-quinone oxidoreductase subunit N
MFEVIFLSLLIQLPIISILILIFNNFHLRFVFFFTVIGFGFLFSLCLYHCGGFILFSFSNIHFCFSQFSFMSVYVIFLLIFILFLLFDDLFDNETAIILCCLLVFSLCAVSALDFISIYILIESINICVFILIVYSKRSIRSVEASLKYLTINLVSSAILLFGICCLYIQFGTFSFDSLMTLRHYLNFSEYLVFDFLGIFFISMSFLIKISVFPYHRWLLDVYTGLHGQALWIVTCFSKPVLMIIFSSVIRLISQFAYDFLNWFLIIGVLSLLYGTVVLLFEYQTRLFIGLLSLISSGTALIILSIPKFSLGLFLVYLVSQSLILCFFLNFLSFSTSSIDVAFSIKNQINMLHYNQLYTVIYFLIILSIIGVPPFIMFLPKFLLLLFLSHSKYYLLICLILFTSFLNAIALLKLCFFFIQLDLKNNLSFAVVNCKKSIHYILSIILFLVNTLSWVFFLFCSYYSNTLISQILCGIYYI